MTKDKNGQNRGGARTPEIPYRKVRLEFWDLFSKLVESNHMLNSVNERSDTWLREQFEKLRDLKNQNDNLAASNIHLREENRELEEEIEQLKKRLN